jgi:yecA family protein
MTRYEAYIEKNWEELGLAHLLISRTREDGSTDYAVFLVDLFCLGVKDAFFEAAVSEEALREFVDLRLPDDMRERFHPACAKKLIEGALAYADSLGFTPHRDFRKARKILSGIDASVCPREFTYGRDGRPCYVRGSDDTEERVDRICSILEARCGIEGFDYEDPGEEDDADLEDELIIRNDLLEWLDAEPPDVPRFYEVSGLMTAMLICPTVLSPLKIMEVLWGADGRTWRDKAELQKFTDLLFPYWNGLNDLIQDALTPGAPPGTQILDIWEEDFEEEADGIEMAAATFAWAVGFRRATELWPAAWGGALSRPDLTPHWEVISWWAGFDQQENRDLMIAHAEANPPRTLNKSVLALARALRPTGPPPV